MKQLLSRAFTRAPDLKHAPTSQPLVALHLGGRAAWSGRDYSALSREGYQRNAIVYRCIRLISEAAASVPICARRGQVCEPGDPAAKFLARGNPMATPTEIMESFYGFNMIETAQGLSFASFGTEAKFALGADDIVGDLSQAISQSKDCLLYTSPSPRDLSTSRMPSSA